MEVFLKGITYFINKINWTSFQCVFGLSVIIMKIHYCIHNNEKWASCLFAFWRGHPPTPTCLVPHNLSCTGLLCSISCFGVAEHYIWETEGLKQPGTREWSQQSLAFRPQAWPLLAAALGGGTYLPAVPWEPCGHSAPSWGSVSW